MRRIHIFRFTIAILFAALLNCHSGQAEDHFVRTQAEFDKVREAELLPGDSIQLERGRRFAGMLAPRGSGTEESPVRITTYGDGKRPRIDAGGANRAGLLLKNVSHCEVDGLEITNTNGSEQDQGDLFGIYVLADSYEGTRKHVHINDCYVHDVNGNVAGKLRGGIHVHIVDLKATIFDDLRITNNRIVDVGGVGIGNTSSCGRVEFRKRTTRDHNLWTRVYVADNFIDHTGRNNVIARCSKDAIYERNVLANSSRYDTGHSIFCFNTNGIKIQHNEAYGNVGNDKIDRGGFDADYNCVNTFIQYNYSHDNQWFCGIMKRRNRNVTIRYNISQNEREGLYFYGFETSAQAENVRIYNNTHYVGARLGVAVFPKGRTPLNSTFENNLFLFEGEGSWGTNPFGVNTKFRNNLYYNLPPHLSDERPMVSPPLLVKPGMAGANINWQTKSSLLGYRPTQHSPLIDTGVIIKGHPGRDFLGNHVFAGAVDLGAIEYQP